MFMLNENGVLSENTVQKEFRDYGDLKKANKSFQQIRKMCYRKFGCNIANQRMQTQAVQIFIEISSKCAM